MGIFSKLFKKENNYEEELKKEASELHIQSEIADLNSNGSFEFLIEDVFTITGRGTVVTGKALSGSAKVNDIVFINSIQSEITGIEMFRKSLDVINAGDNAGLLLKGISREMVKRGDVIKK